MVWEFDAFGDTVDQSMINVSDDRASSSRDDMNTLCQALMLTSKDCSLSDGS